MGGRNEWTLWVVFFAAWACARGHQVENENLWNPTMEQVEWLQKFHGNPAERAAEGVPKLLLGEHLPPRQSNKKRDLSWLEGIYLPSTNASLVSPECASDVQNILRVLESDALIGVIMQKGRFWPILLPDSWGKVPDGLIYGNYLLWGMMEECTGLNVDEALGFPWNYNVTFQGRYCLVSTASHSNRSPITPIACQSIQSLAISSPITPIACQSIQSIVSQSIQSLANSSPTTPIAHQSLQ
ncbi:hypothetical protein C7M84_001383 [Penaeus vannamei]|uniref:Nose resistant-to-fluoxetine protein N-terminal domain-containing protein n=1 Tax=Penaeus vannamei TaxID=6689 RepID=A0A423TTY6_PENVA|nr:hypothetical protein C7M84_001383 [Penaeus vannamei]